MRILNYKKIFSYKKLFLAIFIVVLGISFRVFLNKIIKIPNFEATTALILISGSFFGGVAGMLIALTIMFFSDFYFGNAFIFIFTWSAFVLIGFFGTLLKKNSSDYSFKATGAGIFCVIFFYLWTNFGWWLTFGMYSMTPGGLFQCYLAGLPFLKNQLLSAIIFTPLFALIFSFLFRSLGILKREQALDRNLNRGLKLEEK